MISINKKFKYNIFNKNIVRYYPGSIDPESKFSENTTERDIKEYNDKIDNAVKDLKYRDEEMNDKIISIFDNCSDLKETEEANQSLINEIKGISGKFLEEVKEDYKNMKNNLDDSSYTPESQDKIKAKLDKDLEEIVADEAKVVIDLLKKLENEYKETRDYHKGYSKEDLDSDLDLDTEYNSNNKSKSDSDSDNKNTTKESPIDFVLEQKSIDGPDITDMGDDS